jgi:predicted RNA binding protein YcfA (HicA-like mRNA interferase family)
MASLKGKTTNKNLLKKGFIQANGDHNYFEFWYNGTFVVKTKTSHNNQDISDGLISAMAKQCKVSNSFFKEFAKCNKSEEDYIQELKSNKII